MLAIPGKALAEHTLPLIATCGDAGSSHGNIPGDTKPHVKITTPASAPR